MMKVSYTSWFLDAFNYAIHSNIDVLNLSIGGPDFLDKPFVEKVWELSANNIIVISAIGNDGPLFGTLNNPADMLDVIGVGSVDNSGQVSPFSSRGMTMWELPEGYGRAKPDVLAPGQSIIGSKLFDGCRVLSGTSVASPVVAGIIALLISSLSKEEKERKVNPASIKQILLESSQLVQGSSVFEQGAGQIQLIPAYDLLMEYEPRASFFPSSLDLTRCPYMWPFCSQALYATGQPISINVTILNGMAVTGRVSKAPEWIPSSASASLDVLRVSLNSHSQVIWPWTGYLAVDLQVNPSETYRDFSGIIEGVIRMTISSPSRLGKGKTQESTLQLPLRVNIMPTPERSRRVLWDQFHQLSYPLGFFPRDLVWSKSDPFDWNGDHIHTNFKEMYTRLRHLGYFVEVLGEPLTCFNAENYGVLMIVDPEDSFHSEEIKKLEIDVKQKGLSVVLVADWFHPGIMEEIRFFDENTQKWWKPVTGGTNIPALNQLLKPFRMAFGKGVYEGSFRSENGRLSGYYGSGTEISRFPERGYLGSFLLKDTAASFLKGQTRTTEVAIFGLATAIDDVSGSRDRRVETGRLVLFGDSSCFDDSSRQSSCLDLIDHFLSFASQGLISDDLLLGSRELLQPFDKGPESIVLSHSSKAEFSVLSRTVSNNETENFERFLRCRGDHVKPSADATAQMQTIDPDEIVWQVRSSFSFHSSPHI